MQSFLQGRSVLKSNNLPSNPSSSGFKALDVSSPAISIASDTSLPAGEQPSDTPKIELHNSADGKLHRISITCTCGKHIELQCEY